MNVVEKNLNENIPPTFTIPSAFVSINEDQMPLAFTENSAPLKAKSASFGCNSEEVRHKENKKDFFSVTFSLLLILLCIFCQIVNTD